MSHRTTRTTALGGMSTAPSAVLSLISRYLTTKTTVPVGDGGTTSSARATAMTVRVRAMGVTSDRPLPVRPLVHHCHLGHPRHHPSRFGPPSRAEGHRERRDEL